ncbi:hypothetical protein ARALYDRAFT_891433 [Arabidopsis lyrata subsp. lyrata]|uniref:Uncharacterized protein n=1 Tax=Arabidopsis lyrata subsp. lyrata TaxID=81972 RepID=D7KPR8_ARALL|nr:hypothetical protein ARALYDRAFT_891433 [Arabidopsis lyrata subsp. lyrata]
MGKGLADLRVEMNNNSMVVCEFKKEMSAKDALYMHRFEEITTIAKQKHEYIEKKIELLLVSKKCKMIMRNDKCLDEQQEAMLEG